MAADDPSPPRDGQDNSNQKPNASAEKASLEAWGEIDKQSQNPSNNSSANPGRTGEGASLHGDGKSLEFTNPYNQNSVFANKNTQKDGTFGENQTKPLEGTGNDKRKVGESAFDKSNSHEKENIEDPEEEKKKKVKEQEKEKDEEEKKQKDKDGKELSDNSSKTEVNPNSEEGKGTPKKEQKKEEIAEGEKDKAAEDKKDKANENKPTENNNGAHEAGSNASQAPGLQQSIKDASDTPIDAKSAKPVEEKQTKVNENATPKDDQSSGAKDKPLTGMEGKADAAQSNAEAKSGTEGVPKSDTVPKADVRPTSEKKDKAEGSVESEKLRRDLAQRDTNIGRENAQHIKGSLKELSQWVGGRSTEVINQDVRDTLAGMNSQQITAANREYRGDTGKTLGEAIQNDPNLSQGTKDAAKIYMQGSDKRTDKDTRSLTDIALREQNLGMFAEAMRDASPQARKDFMANSGKYHLEQAFGHWNSNKDLNHALDYAKNGKLSTTTLVKEHSSSLSSNLTNKDGIDLAVKSMSPEERKEYTDGKALTEAKAGKRMTEDERAQSKTYRELSAALSNASNPTDFAKWESMISNPDGNLDSALAEHRGNIYNSSASEIKDTIGSSMNKADWQYAKDHPKESRAEMAKMLNSLDQKPEDTKDMMDLYDKKVAAGSFEEAQKIGAPSATEKSEARAEDVIDKIKSIDPQTMSIDNVVDALHDIDQMFQKHPDWQKRITDPQNAEEREYSDSFKKAVSDTLSSAPDRPFAYDKEANSLIEKGSVDFADRMALRGDDLNGALGDIKDASAADKARLKEDDEYREKALSGLNPGQKEVAHIAIQQGKMQPEDIIRQSVVGGGESKNIVAELKTMNPESLKRAEKAYMEKYGSLLQTDVLGKLGGQEKREAQRVFNQQLSLNTQKNIAREEIGDTQSSWATTLSGLAGSATSVQLRDLSDRIVQSTAEASRLEASLKDQPEQRQAVQNSMAKVDAQNIALAEKGVDNVIAANETAADLAATAGTTAVAIGGAILTSGSTVPLTTAALLAGAAGAGTNVAIRAGLGGADYNTDLSNITKDAAAGFVDGVTMGLGPELMLAKSGLGKAAESAGAAAFKQVLSQEGKAVFAKDAEQTLVKGSRELMDRAITSGSKRMDYNATKALADKTINPDLTGSTRRELVTNLTKAIDEKLTDTLNPAVTKATTGSAAGAGTLNAMANSTANWDNSKPVGDNASEALKNIFTTAAMSGLTGGIMGKASGAVNNRLRTFARKIDGERAAQKLETPAQALSNKDFDQNFKTLMAPVKEEFERTGKFDSNSPEVQRATKEVLAYAEKAGAKAGIPAEVIDATIKVDIDPKIAANAVHKASENMITFFPSANGNTVHHEIAGHMSDTLQRTAARVANPEAYENRQMANWLAEVGKGTTRTFPNDRGGFGLEPRPHLNDKARTAMQEKLKQAKLEIPGSVDRAPALKDVIAWADRLDNAPDTNLSNELTRNNTNIVNEVMSELTSYRISAANDTISDTVLNDPANKVLKDYIQEQADGLNRWVERANNPTASVTPSMQTSSTGNLANQQTNLTEQARAKELVERLRSQRAEGGQAGGVSAAKAKELTVMDNPEIAKVTDDVFRNHTGRDHLASQARYQASYYLSSEENRAGRIGAVSQLRTALAEAGKDLQKREKALASSNAIAAQKEIKRLNASDKLMNGFQKEMAKDNPDLTQSKANARELLNLLDSSNAWHQGLAWHLHDMGLLDGADLAKASIPTSYRVGGLTRNTEAVNNSIRALEGGSLRKANNLTKIPSNSGKDEYQLSEPLKLNVSFGDGNRIGQKPTEATVEAIVANAKGPVDIRLRHSDGKVETKSILDLYDRNANQYSFQRIQNRADQMQADGTSDAMLDSHFSHSGSEPWRVRLAAHYLHELSKKQAATKGGGF